VKAAKLQLALDLPDMDQALRIAGELEEFWDILEVGTVLLLKEGLNSISQFRQAFPNAKILADTKIIDSGNLLTEIACQAGADICTVVSAASYKTIEACVATAKKHSCKVLMDHVSNNWRTDDLAKKCSLGADLVGLHLPKDNQAEKLLDVDAVADLSRKINGAISIAGGIDPDKITQLKNLPIDVFVVGGYLLTAKDRKERARIIKERILKKEN